MRKSPQGSHDCSIGKASDSSSGSGESLSRSLSEKNRISQGGGLESMVDLRVLSEKAPDKSPIDATPKAKDIFHGYTRGGYTVTAAVAEYVDNAIEQARVSGIGKNATVQVTVSSFGP